MRHPAIMALFQLPGEVRDAVLQHLPARELLRVRATCRTGEILLSRDRLLELKSRPLRDRVVVIVRRYLAYGTLEFKLSRALIWDDTLSYTPPILDEDTEDYACGDDRAVAAIYPLTENFDIITYPFPDPVAILQKIVPIAQSAIMEGICKLLFAIEVRCWLWHQQTDSPFPSPRLTPGTPVAQMCDRSVSDFIGGHALCLYHRILAAIPPFAFHTPSTEPLELLEARHSDPLWALDHWGQALADKVSGLVIGLTGFDLDWTSLTRNMPMRFVRTVAHTMSLFYIGYLTRELWGDDEDDARRCIRDLYQLWGWEGEVDWERNMHLRQKRLQMFEPSETQESDSE